MEQRADGEAFAGEPGGGVPQLLRGVGTHTHQRVGIQDGDEGKQVFHAYCVHGGALFRRQFVRRNVGSGGSHPDQRTVIGHVIVTEEVFRSAESFREKSPEAAAADFRPGAAETLHGTFGVGMFRPSDFSADVQPVDDGVHFPERDACLGHAEGAGIHAQEQMALFPVSVGAHILFMRPPCIGERVVGNMDRGFEPELLRAVPEGGRGFQNGCCSVVHASAS